MPPKKRAYEGEMIRQKDDLNLSDEQVREYEQLKDQANRESAIVQSSLLTARQVFEHDQSALKNELKKQSNQQTWIKVKEEDHRRIQWQIVELQGKIQSTEGEEKALRKKMKGMVDEVKIDKSALNNYEAELISVNRQLSDGSSGDNAEVKRNQKRQRALNELKRAFPGNVFGRLVELVQPSHKRFNVATTKILEKHMNSIVCDTQETALNCVRYLEEHYYSREAFLPQWCYPDESVILINEKLREMRRPPGVKLLFDVIKVQHRAARRALLFVCENTLVCETPDDAKKLADGSAEGMRGERYKAVSIDGTLFRESGVMSRASDKLRTKSKIWDEKVVKQLREKRDNLNEKITDLQKNRRKEMEVESVRSKVTDLTNRLTNFKKELIDLQQTQLQRVQNELEELASELEQIPPKIAHCQERLRKSKAEVRALETRSNEVADRIFADFCQRIGIASIRDYENREMRNRSSDDDSSKKSRTYSPDDSARIPESSARELVRRFSPQPSNPKVQELHQRKRQRKMDNEESQESVEESENHAPDDSDGRAENSSPARSMNTEDHAPNDSAGIRESGAREQSSSKTPNPGIQSPRVPKVEEVPEAPSSRKSGAPRTPAVHIPREKPIKTEPGVDVAYTSQIKFLKAIQSLVLNLDTPSLSPLKTKIDKKLRESPTEKITNDELILVIELLVVKIAKHSMLNLPENVESVRFSDFLCFLKAAISNSKLEGLKGLLEKIKDRIKEPISKDKNIPVEEVASALHSILRATGF